MKIYLVGGAVRDKLLGIESKDLDYTVVIPFGNLTTVEEGFLMMKDYMEKEGFEIFLETPEMFTIRARFPKDHKNAGTTADFVLARKEVGYVEGTRRPILELGSLHDDLERRDFTVNAMAEDENGNLIDPFDGQTDLQNKLLVTPLDPEVTFMDDPLRTLRALRFSITKGMNTTYEIRQAMRNPAVLKKMKEVVSKERIREELEKMFKHDTIRTMKVLSDADERYFYGLLDVCFGDGEMWIKPTMKQR